MIKIRLLLLTLLLAPLTAVFADVADAVKSPKGYGSKGYVWGKLLPEQVTVLKLTGDPVRGKEAFRGCRGCHKADAAGVTDGTYPRLTGQHARVVIKQVTEVRAGIRVNPKMEPFSADHAVSPQEIADIAVFLATAETTRENGKGDGDAVAKGKKLYEQGRCRNCHGTYGEGDADGPYPVIAAQHYGYLKREMEYIKKGIRGNSHPDMVRAIRNYSHEDIDAMADYLSRLPDYRQSLAERKGK
jgi:cytochrome c553